LANQRTGLITQIRAFLLERVALGGCRHMEASKGFRRLKACKHLPVLKAGLVAHTTNHLIANEVEANADAA
jgi:hypothetical protein